MAENGDGFFFAVVVFAEGSAEGGVAGGAGIAVGEEGDALVWAVEIVSVRFVMACICEGNGYPC